MSSERMTKVEAARALQLKKSLMEMIQGIRYRNELESIPKAIMTEAMAAKGTAVINCGDDAKIAAKLSEGILAGYEAKAFCQLYKKYNVTFEREIRRNVWDQPVPCLRVRFDLRGQK